MRITNKMMTNNMMSNINKNKLNMSDLEQQYSTGKKIQKPSEDPIIAVRALKLRTNLTELNQYYEKNIPDAKSWMDVTESSLSTVNEILSSINSYCVQGSSDTLTATDRAAIVENLQRLKEQIYQEGNTNYAGRYVFTGYKTDTPLIFTEATTDLSYLITETFTGDQIQATNKVVGGYTIKDYEDYPTNPFTDAPQMIDTYRLRLSYDDLSSAKDEVPTVLNYARKNAGGELEDQIGFNVITKKLTDPNPYEPGADEVYFIPETGELILGSGVYKELRTADKISVSYTKNNFNSGDLRPEHYFDCVMTDTGKPEQEPIKYKKETQKIEYEVNFNQKLTINTEGSDAITHQMGRCITDIMDAVDAVLEIEGYLTEIDNRLKDTSLTQDQITGYEKLKEQMETELTLKKEIMQKAFSAGITTSSEEQNRVNVAIADLGSRHVRLDLTEDRLSGQKVDFTELLSSNEDADIAETIIKFNMAETVYNASLNAAGRIVKNSLLDFL